MFPFLSQRWQPAKKKPPSWLTGSSNVIRSIPDQVEPMDAPMSMTPNYFPVFNKSGQIVKGEPIDLAHLVMQGAFPYSGGAGVPSAGASIGKGILKAVSKSQDLPSPQELQIKSFRELSIKAGKINPNHPYVKAMRQTIREAMEATTSSEKSAALMKIEGTLEQEGLWNKVHNIVTKHPRVWGEAEFHKSVSPEAKEQLDKLVSILPKDFKFPLKRIMIPDTVKKFGTDKQYAGDANSAEGLIRLAKRTNFAGKEYVDGETFYHEFAHLVHPTWSESKVSEFGSRMFRRYQLRYEPEKLRGIHYVGGRNDPRNNPRLKGGR